MPVLHYRSVFISDLHLGTKDAHSEQLLDFLRHLQCDHLYLLGDVIDLWKAQSGWNWSPLSHNVMHMILDKARNGTKVTYVPGNHDESFRGYVDTVFEGIHIAMEAEHVTTDGRRFLLVHGDEFDNAVRHSRILHALGSWAYDVLLLVNRWQNNYRRRFGLGYWSLAGYLKQRAGQARKHIEHYEQAAAHEAAKRGFDGIVCGHVHHAACQQIQGVEYFNTGDWVESCSAIVEHSDGSMQLLRWPLEREALLDNAIPCRPVAGLAA